jgi:hypothetical protein
MKIKSKNIRHLASAPFIWGVLPAVVALDIAVTIYQSICFKLYNIEVVKKNEYIKFDRHKLKYLNIIQKINCTYCAYVNGLLPFATEVAARTERYWCAIGHDASKEKFYVPQHHKDFAKYGDGRDPSNYNED